MDFWLTWASRIDRLTAWMGRVAFGCTLVMILIGAFNAVARYASRFIGLNLSSNAFIEMQWYLFSVVFLLGGAYALKCGAHVRVDVVYGRFSPKTRAWINLMGTILFLLPFAGFMIWVSWPAVTNSWRVWEQSPDPGGLPRYPIKTLVPLAFALLIFQSGAEIIKQIAFLRGEASDPTAETSMAAAGDML